MSDIAQFMLPALGRLLRADLVIYHYLVDPAARHQIDIGWPAEVFLPKRVQEFTRLAPAHPLIRHLPVVLATAPRAPFAISELLPTRTWFASEVYLDAMKNLACDDQIALILRTWGGCHEAITFGRAGSIFGDREHELLKLSRQQITEATARARLSSQSGWVALQVQPDVSWVRPGSPEPLDRASPLTKREGEVVVLLATGLSDRRIAERLGISTRTVNKHLQNVYRKLDVAGRWAVPHVTQRMQPSAG